MKTALITGASSGIGRAIAHALIDHGGYAVYAAARRVERMAPLVERGARAICMDVTSERDLVTAVDRIRDETGGVDVLINNAGFGLYGSVEETSLEEARRQFEVNLFGLARLTQEVLPDMRRRGAGTIVNVSSVGGRIFTPLGAWYHASKHALEGWSDCLRYELRPFGIDVVVVQPGVIRTEFGEVMTDAMLKRSGEGAYASLARALAASQDREYAAGTGSPAAAVASVVLKALRARRPRTRYTVGRYAWTLLTLRAWLTDRGFERVLDRLVTESR